MSARDYSMEVAARNLRDMILTCLENGETVSKRFRTILMEGCEEIRQAVNMPEVATDTQARITDDYTQPRMDCPECDGRGDNERGDDFCQRCGGLRKVSAVLTMWAQVVCADPNDLDTPYVWDCHAEGDKGDRMEEELVELRASTFPLGTRLQIIEPATP